MLATPAECPALSDKRSNQGVNLFACAVFHGTTKASEPFTSLVDKAPFPILPNGCLAALKLSGIFKAGLNRPLLVFIDKSPFAVLRLNGCQTLAE